MISRRCQVVVLFRVFRGSIVSPSSALPLHHAESLWVAIEVALATWPDRVVWEQLIRNGMEADWSWTHSAAEYTRLYDGIIRRVQALPVQPVVGESAPLR